VAPTGRMSGKFDKEVLHDILFLENPNLVKVGQIFRMTIQARLILLSALSVTQQFKAGTVTVPMHETSVIM